MGKVTQEKFGGKLKKFLLTLRAKTWGFLRSIAILWFIKKKCKKYVIYLLTY